MSSDFSSSFLGTSNTDAAANGSSGNDSSIAFSCDQNIYVLLVIVAYPLAFFVILILALLSCRGRCCIRSGCQALCIYPINMLDGYKDRLGYACIFGSMTVQLIDVLLKGNTLSGAWAIMDSKELNIPPYPFISPLIKVLTLLINVGIITTAFYPLFVCLSTDYRFVGAVLGLLCASYRLCFGLWIVSECQLMSDYLAKHPLIRYNTLIYNMPALVCCTGLVAKFIYEAVRCIRKGRLGYYPKEQRMANHHHVKHVTRLLGAAPLPWSEGPDPETFGQKLKALFTYRSNPYFRFPMRMVATVVILITATYQIGLMVIFTVWTFILDLEEASASYASFVDYVGIIIAYLVKDYLQKLHTWLHLANEIWVSVTAVTLLLGAMFIFRACVCYRRHVYMVYRGDRSIFPQGWSNTASQNIMTNAVRYAGLQVAFFMWGFVIIQVALFLVAFFITFVLIIPAAEFQYYNILITIAEVVVIPVALSIAIYQSQVIITRFLFLQPKQNKDDQAIPLAVNNRHAFYNVSLFYFFFNILLGAVAAIMRILKGLVFGLFLIPRIDRCVMMQGYESMDAGFMCYLSMLAVVTAHDHPVVRVFLKILSDAAFERSHCKGEKLALSQTSRKARHLWSVAYTLVNNPALIRYRKNRDTQPSDDPMAKHRQQLAERKKNEGAKTSTLYESAAECDNNSSIELTSCAKSPPFVVKPPIHPAATGLPGTAD